MAMNNVTPTGFSPDDQRTFEAEMRGWIHGKYCSSCKGSEKKFTKCEEAKKHLTLSFNYESKNDQTGITVTIANKMGGETKLWLAQPDNLFALGPHAVVELFEDVCDGYLEENQSFVKEGSQRLSVGSGLRPKKRADIAIVMDSTASRTDSIKATKTALEQMFKKFQKAGDNGVELRVKIINYGGGSVYESRWFNDLESLTTHMRGIDTISGETKLCDSLDAILLDPKNRDTSAVIAIGDDFNASYYESEDRLKRIATEFNARRIPIHSFFDSLGGASNPHTARNMFTLLTELTGGIFRDFGNGLKGTTQENMTSNMNDLFDEVLRKALEKNAQKTAWIPDAARTDLAGHAHAGKGVRAATDRTIKLALGA